MSACVSASRVSSCANGKMVSCSVDASHLYVRPTGHRILYFFSFFCFALLFSIGLWISDCLSSLSSLFQLDDIWHTIHASRKSITFRHFFTLFTSLAFRFYWFHCVIGYCREEDEQCMCMSLVVVQWYKVNVNACVLTRMGCTKYNVNYYMGWNGDWWAERLNPQYDYKL